MADKVIAVIPARGGSKGIYKKNIRDVCGYPLIYYQLKNACSAERVDQVVLATDDAEIAQIGQALFPEQIGIVMRPPEISHDLAKTEETLLYVLETVTTPDNHFEIIVTLEPTNPLNRPEYVDNLIRLVADEGYDSACCVIDDYGFFLDTPAEIERLIERPMRQEITPKLRETGNGWATRTAALVREKNRLAGQIGCLKIAAVDSHHLDDVTDWRMIEALLRPRVNRENGRYFKVRSAHTTPSAYEEEYWGVVTDPDGVARNRKTEKEKRLRECAQELAYLDGLPPGKVLDVGCGLGFLLSGIPDSWEKYGVEVSSVAARHAGAFGDIFHGELSQAAFEADFFDVVMLYHVIEHMVDPEESLKEIHRILKPYGRLVIGTPDFECGLAQRFGENFRLLQDDTHIRLFNSLGLYRILMDHQFEIEQICYPYFDTEHFTLDNLKRLFDTSKISPPFYGNIVTFYCYKK